jgi:hypothetical protein
MKNIVLGIIILLLYFGNYHISMFLSNGNNDLFWNIKPAIYSLIILIAIKYKENSNFIEKLFISMVMNNIYVLIFKDETTYTLNDLWMIGIFFVAQYIGKKKKDE